MILIHMGHNTIIARLSEKTTLRRLWLFLDFDKIWEMTENGPMLRNIPK